MNLQQIGEFGFIDRIQKRFSTPDTVPLGIGDDVAAVLPSPRKLTLLTTDTLQEAVHFDRSLSSFFQVGYKSVSVNISDIAAMGGEARYFLISLGLTDRMELADLDKLYRGIAKASREAGIFLVGGNTCRSEKHFFISITLLGEIAKKEMILRSGAKVGDALYVTGTLGDASAGLALLKKKENRRTFSRLIGRYQSPQARFCEGRFLAKKGIPSAMIDISDGLTADLVRLMRQSRVGAELRLDHIPLSKSLVRYTSQCGRDPLQFALNGGEDYELLFSVPEKKVRRLEGCVKNGLIQAVRIGTIVPIKTGLVIKNSDESRTKIEPKGYDHFKRRKVDPS